LAELIQHALAMLGGRLDRGDGLIVGGPSRAVSLVAADDTPARIREVLDAGGRAAIPVGLDAAGLIARLTGVLLARRRIGNARRRLTAAGATQVRAIAIVPGQDALALVYEIGPRVQHYVEQHVVLETRGDSPLVRRLKRLLGHVGGVAVGVVLVIVVGERQ
jgi:hypothetical protein